MAEKAPQTLADVDPAVIALVRSASARKAVNASWAKTVDRTARTAPATRARAAARARARQEAAGTTDPAGDAA